MTEFGVRDSAGFARCTSAGNGRQKVMTSSASFAGASRAGFSSLQMLAELHPVLLLSSLGLSGSATL